VDLKGNAFCNSRPLTAPLASREAALEVKATDSYADVAEREWLIARLETEGLVTKVKLVEHPEVPPFAAVRS
jgi:hypothetical protein